MLDMHRARRTGKRVLTPKEESFISAYLGGASSAPSAAAKAGYKSPQKVAFQLLHKPHIAAEIGRRRRAIRREKEEFDIHKLLEWLSFSATFDPTTIFKPGTSELLPPAEWSDQRLLRLVESIKSTEDEDGTKSTEVRFVSRNPNLDLIARLKGVPRKIPVMPEDTRNIPPSLIAELARRAEQWKEIERAMNGGLKQSRQMRKRGSKKTETVSARKAVIDQTPPSAFSLW